MILSRSYNNLDPFLTPNKVLVIFGPGQAGKTTLLEHYFKAQILNIDSIQVMIFAYRKSMVPEIKIKFLNTPRDMNLPPWKKHFLS